MLVRNQGDSIVAFLVGLECFDLHPNADFAALLSYCHHVGERGLEGKFFEIKFCRFQVNLRALFLENVVVDFLKSPAIIREFADYITAGSRIHVLLKNPQDSQIAEIDALNEELESIDVGLIQKDCLSIEDLLSVKPFEYDNIIILAGNGSKDIDIDAARIDSENIVALLLLRRIFSQYPNESRNTKLITEILDSQNDALVAKAGVQDVIISNRLVSMIMAQISGAIAATAPRI